VKPIQPRAAAETDVDHAFEHYRMQGGHALAERFVDAYDAALAHIAQHPGTGSPRHARAIRIKNLRFWTLTRFPFSVFYGTRGPHRRAARAAPGQRHPPSPAAA
jgi:toxin ParE1/3/4